MVHFLSIIAFMVVSFAAQSLSHFIVNKEHYSAITHLRSDPIIPLGLLAMVIQGLIISMALSAWRGSEATIANGWLCAMAFGVFLMAYIALVEPAKYIVPNISAWMGVEVIVGLMQFTVFGLILGFIHARWG